MGLAGLRELPCQPCPGLRHRSRAAGLGILRVTESPGSPLSLPFRDKLLRQNRNLDGTSGFLPFQTQSLAFTIQTNIIVFVFLLPGPGGTAAHVRDLLRTLPNPTLSPVPEAASPGSRCRALPPGQAPVTAGRSYSGTPPHGFPPFPGKRARGEACRERAGSGCSPGNGGAISDRGGGCRGGVRCCEVLRFEWCPASAGPAGALGLCPAR